MDVPWLLDFEDQLYKFPAGRIKDAVDSMGQAILYLEHLLTEGWRARERMSARTDERAEKRMRERILKGLADV